MRCKIARAAALFLATVVLAVPNLAAQPPSPADGADKEKPTDAESNKKDKANFFRALKLYDEALDLKKTEEFEECESKVKEILALKDVDPYLVSQAWAILAEVHLKTEQFMQAVKCYEKAISVARTLSGHINKKALLRWELFVELLHKYPTGEYEEKSLSDEKVMKKALKELATDRVKKLEELLKSATTAEYYTRATSIVDRAEDIIQEIEILDPPSVKEAKEKVWKTEADLLATEVKRLMNEAEEARSEVLANKPGEKPKKVEGQRQVQRPG